METVPEREYELDYLITPELGGIADRRNLWPERYDSRVWNAHVKDELERLLPQLVCQGRLDLVTAQQDIAANWIVAYQKYFQTVTLRSRGSPERLIMRWMTSRTIREDGVSGSGWRVQNVRGDSSM